MNISEKRTKLSELSARASTIHSLAEKEERVLTTDENKEFNSIMDDFNGLKDEIANDEKRAAFMNGAKDYLGAMQNKPTEQKIEQDAQKKDEEVKLIDYFLSLRAQKWPKEFRDQNMGSGAAGGFLVEQQYMPGLKAIGAEAGIIRQRATIIPAGSPPDAKITIPVLNQGANGEFAGVSVVWIAEGGTKTETSAVMTEAELEPAEVAASLNITDKLLRNAPQAAGIYETLLRGSLARAEEMAFISGNGVGKPLGITNSAAHIDISRTSASSIAFADIRNMFTRFMATSWERGIWVANQTTFPQICAIADAAGNNLFVAGDVTKGLRSSLFGLPIFFNGMTPVLGSAGDLMLLDPMYYLIKEGSGPFVASSPHVYFTTNVTVIKIFDNVDGDSWVTAPLLLEDGSTTVSPFIVLN